ncbi:MAG: alpha-ketoglutarate-dependent dioxygenase AlkB family protein [Beijerinckiaceae bacterium]
MSLFAEGPEELAPGLILYRGHLDPAAQAALLEDVRAVVRAAPLFVPLMPKTGKPFSVRMTNCGPLGWVSDIAGYRYQPTHPATREPWPAMPATLLALWSELGGFPALPEACLMNWYDTTAKMGLHQDRDEQSFDAPVLSVSLGDACLFRYGGLKRTDPTRSLRLMSGDALIIGGASRLCFHGVDRIYPGTSPLLPNGGRINLTLRRVNPAG